ncbi:gastrula zinc finger protein XlCGF8.2DB [Syngnathus scovelli]|uniref:gastrula zinc finger protein XlCGF8.2DB n=1 Tax=Syngnathus scovelli TaxID=161590 RepID=UPI00210FEF79|nr:gastrula zinc finger protein XlCGF8.2DB [Syngnathus scovelli]
MEQRVQKPLCSQVNVKSEGLPRDVLKVVVGQDERPAVPCVKEEGREDECPPIKEEEEEWHISQTEGHVARSPVKVEDEGRQMAGGELSRTLASPAEDISPEADSLLAALHDEEVKEEESPSDTEESDGSRDSGENDERFECRQCGKGFGKRKNLSTHMSLHTGEAFSCSFCSKAFKKRYNLLIHARVHTGEKPFACSLCGLKFSQKASLLRHATTHSGHKTFTCAVCNLSLCQRSDLIVHSRIHTGEKPFDCSLCGARFSQKGSLARHARTHTGEKPFSCSVCAGAYSRRSALLNHQKAHGSGRGEGLGTARTTNHNANDSRNAI